VSRRLGSFVVLAGPDGSGKSSLAARIVAANRRTGRPARHMHWRPGLLPHAGTVVMRPPRGDSSDPHAVEPHGTVVSLVRLVYYWMDFLVGSWLRVSPVRRRGGLVVMERGWWDMLVDPRRYNLRHSRGLVRFLGRLLPAPDVVVVLHAPPEVLTHRKKDLPSSELARQNDLWVQLDLPTRTAKIVLDATRSLDDLVAEATTQIGEVSSDDRVGTRGSE